MAEFRMPSLGADMEAGTLIEWLVKPGDKVSRGDVVAVVDTHKGAIDMEIFQSGVVEEIRVPVGAKVPVGTVLALIRGPQEGKAGLTAASAATQAVPESSPRAPAPEASPASMAVADKGRMRISPVARRRAIELGVDLTEVTGSGSAGAITLDDVERAAGVVQRSTRAAGDRQAGMRQAMAAAMARSKREIPHYYLAATIDMGRALEWLTSENEKRPVPERLLYGVLLLKAVALALRKVPELNGFWMDGEFHPSRNVHVGTAIAVRGGGLIAPALHDVDSKSVDALMADLRDLVQRVRAGSLRSSEMSDATITVTSLGEQGVDTVFGVIYPPQVALVGFGRVAQRPWLINSEIRPRPLLEATLAADHRASDGHRGSLLLATVNRFLQEPETL